MPLPHNRSKRRLHQTSKTWIACSTSCSSRSKKSKSCALCARISTRLPRCSKQTSTTSRWSSKSWPDRQSSRLASTRDSCSTAISQLAAPMRYLYSHRLQRLSFRSSLRLVSHKNFRVMRWRALKRPYLLAPIQSVTLSVETKKNRNLMPASTSYKLWFLYFMRTGWESISRERKRCKSITKFFCLHQVLILFVHDSELHNKALEDPRPRSPSMDNMMNVEADNHEPDSQDL